MCNDYAYSYNDIKKFKVVANSIIQRPSLYRSCLYRCIDPQDSTGKIISNDPSPRYCCLRLTSLTQGISGKKNQGVGNVKTAHTIFQTPFLSAKGNVTN